MPNCPPENICMTRKDGKFTVDRKKHESITYKRNPTEKAWEEDSRIQVKHIVWEKDHEGKVDDDYTEV